MAQRIDSEISADRAHSFPRITKFFDGTEYFFERLGDSLEAFGKLLLRTKILLIAILALLATVLALYGVARFEWELHEWFIHQLTKTKG